MSVIDAAFRVRYGPPASSSRTFSKLFDIESNKVKLKQTPQFVIAALIKKPNREVIEACLVLLT